MYDVRETTFRTPRGLVARMAIRDGTNDWNTLAACMTEDEYGLKDYAFTGACIDIGGYLGGVGIGLALDNPEARVIIVEPVPPNAALIRQNIALNSLEDRVTLIEGVAGGTDPISVWYAYRGTESAEHHAFVGNSTLAYDNGGELAHDEVVYDTPWSLTDLMKALKADRVDVVKIDCEGGEWVILADPAVSRVDLIVGESHSVRGHKGSDIVDLLADTHVVTLTGNPDDIAAGGTCGFVASVR
jgi:FkbM family methyltransferase